MNYNKLVSNLRRKAFSYADTDKFLRVLHEAIKRKIESEEHQKHINEQAAKRNEKLLFITN